MASETKDSSDSKSTNADINLENPNCSDITDFLIKKYAWFTPLLKSIQDVYNQLGHGLLEGVYQKAIEQDLQRAGVAFFHEYPVNYLYKNLIIGSGRIDILIEDQAIVELKSQKPEIKDDEIRQLQNYLIHSNKQLGICVNFPKNPTLKLNVIVILCKNIVTNQSMSLTSEQHNGWYFYNIKIPVNPLPIHKINQLDTRDKKRKK